MEVIDPKKDKALKEPMYKAMNIKGTAMHAALDDIKHYVGYKSEHERTCNDDDNNMEMISLKEKLIKKCKKSN